MISTPLPGGYDAISQEHTAVLAPAHVVQGLARWLLAVRYVQTWAFT